MKLAMILVAARAAIISPVYLVFDAFSASLCGSVGWEDPATFTALGYGVHLAAQVCWRSCDGGFGANQSTGMLRNNKMGPSRQPRHALWVINYLSITMSNNYQNNYFPEDSDPSDSKNC